MQEAALVDREVEVNERVVQAEVAQDLREPGQGQVVRDADAKSPARPGLAEVGRRLLVCGEDLAREADHRLAVSRHRYGVRVTLHQDPAGLLLQAAYVLAHGRLMDAEPRGGLGEATGLLDGEERGQELRIVHAYKIT